MWYCKPGQKLVAGKVGDPSGQAAVVVRLNG